jgi:hypothetical protein
MNDQRDLTLIIRSRFPIVLIETHEEARVMALLERVAQLEGQGLFVWSAADGLQRRDNPLAAAPGSYSAGSVHRGPYGKGPIADTLQISGALKPSNTQLADVAGLENLKRWLNQRRAAFARHAVDVVGRAREQGVHGRQRHRALAARVDSQRAL